jgi:hypothetical protein
VGLSIMIRAGLALLTLRFSFRICVVIKLVWINAEEPLILVPGLVLKKTSF